MNEIQIANILIQKRREKGITQEELAAYIGVSKAAVSKWEKEQSYPDISLLPQLASYFNISVDELLGYSPQLTRVDIRKLCKEISAVFINKSFDDGLARCREVTKKYYSCFPLLYSMAILLVNHHTLADERKRQDEVIEEAKLLCERIVSESGDTMLAKSALHIQSLCCIMLRIYDDVFDLLGESLRSTGLAEDHLISQAYELAGNIAKAKEISQCGMYEHLMLLIDSTLTYISLSGDSFDTAQTAHRRVMELMSLYGVNKLDPNIMAKAYLSGAELYCKHGHLDNAFGFLEKYAELCVTAFLPYNLHGDSFFTDIDAWLDDSDLGSLLPFDERLVKQNMLHSLDMFPSLTTLHDDPRYRRLVQKITNFVELQEVHNE